MIETFPSRIKASNLAEMFILAYSLIRNMAPLQNKPLTYVGEFLILSQNQNFLFPDQEPVEFDKILRSECKIRKENDFVEEIFSILCRIFSSR